MSTGFKAHARMQVEFLEPFNPLFPAVISRRGSYCLQVRVKCLVVLEARDGSRHACIFHAMRIHDDCTEQSLLCCHDKRRCWFCMRYLEGWVVLEVKNIHGRGLRLSCRSSRGSLGRNLNCYGVRRAPLCRSHFSHLVFPSAFCCTRLGILHAGEVGIHVDMPTIRQRSLSAASLLRHGITRYAGSPALFLCFSLEIIRLGTKTYTGNDWYLLARSQFTVSGSFTSPNCSMAPPCVNGRMLPRWFFGGAIEAPPPRKTRERWCASNSSHQDEQNGIGQRVG